MIIIIIITIRLSTAANVGKVQEVDHPVPIKFLRGQCVKYNPGSLSTLRCDVTSQEVDNALKLLDNELKGKTVLQYSMQYQDLSQF